MISTADIDALYERLDLALGVESRRVMLEEPHTACLRLFNGFLESPRAGAGMCPDLVVDVYADSLVIFNHASDPYSLAGWMPLLKEFYLRRLPWLQTVLVKARRSVLNEERRGVLIYGEKLARKVREDGVWYALNLTMNQDASLYIDTRNLRAWLKREAKGLRVLNTFAYTGSLGAACVAGGAAQVVQVDMERKFLNLAKDTYSMNGFPVQRADFVTDDFFRIAGQMRRNGEQFDLVILDPPFFSTSPGGRVDLVSESARLVNKVRPLVRNGGRLVVVNNALFVSGQSFSELLEALAGDGYIQLEARIDVPEDVTGSAETRAYAPPADPAPFNHSTKIAVLKVNQEPIPQPLP